MKSKVRKFLLIFVSIFSSLLFLWLAFRKVDWPSFFAITKRANVWLILSAVVVFVASYVLRTFRWQILIGLQSKVKILPAFDCLVSGYAINNVLPFRAGEIFRLFITKHKTGIAKSSVLGTLIIERVWDGLALLFLAFISLVVTQPKNVPTRVIDISGFIFGFIVLAIVILILLDRFILGFLRKIKITDRILEKITLLIASFKNLQNLKILIFSLSLSIFVWTVEAVTYFMVAKSLILDISFLEMLLVLAILNFGILIPASPGYLGTFEYFTILGMTIFGIGQTQAAGFAIILHIAQFIPITLYGGLVISKIGLTSVKNFDE